MSQSGGFSGFRTNVPYQGNGTSIMPMVTSILNRPADEAPKAAPVYDLEHSVPQDFDTWGRKIIGPSASTSEMEGPYPTTAPTRETPTRPAPAASVPARDMTIAQLWDTYNKSGNASDFVRADRAMQEAMKAGKDIGYYGQKVEGEKRGGAVQDKDDTVHKALNIIQHLLSRG